MCAIQKYSNQNKIEKIKAEKGVILTRKEGQQIRCIICK